MFNAVSLAVFSVTFLLAFILLKTRHRNGRRQPPCLWSFPLIGSLPVLPRSIKDYSAFFMKKAEELGPVIAFYAGQQYSVMLNSRDAIDAALIRQTATFAGRLQLYSEAKCSNVELRGIGFKEYNAEFRKQHRIVLAILKEFGEKNSMSERMNSVVEVFVQEAKRHGGEPFDARKLTLSCVSNVMLSIMFGKKFDYGDPIVESAVEEGNTIFQHFLVELDLIPLLRYLPSTRKKFAVLEQVTRKFYATLRNQIQKSSENPGESFVKSYIAREGNDYDSEELMFIIRDLLLAGTDTSSTTILWAMIVLANNSDVQKRLQEELDSVVPRDRLPSSEDRRNLPYMEAAILELMRLRTLAMLSVTRKTTCDTELCGFFLPMGTTVMSNLYGIHMDPGTWKEPEKFNPDRFIDEDGNIYGANRIIPFSIGKRSCIGEIVARQQLFLFFAGIVHQFDVRPPEGHHSIDVDEEYQLVLHPLPFQVRLISR